MKTNLTCISLTGERLFAIEFLFPRESKAKTSSRNLLPGKRGRFKKGGATAQAKVGR